MEARTENYQLKWHSFGSYLHGCVAASLNSDYFTDVSLVTMDGRQIHAHRFILSACSQYLHQVLKLQTKAANIAPLSIILPPEISYRTLKVLVQYMYSGEATVSQDILESVLRGGDLLRVKGLWRPREEEDPPPQERLSERHERKSHSKHHPSTNSASGRHHNNSRTSTPSTTSSTPVPVNSSHRTSPPMQSNNQASNSVIKEPSRTMHEPNEKAHSPPLAKRAKNEESVIKTTQPNPPPLAPIMKHRQLERIDFRQEKQSSGKDNPKEKEINSAKDLMQILVIKEEPLEWSEVNQEDIELVEREEIFHSELIIKPETSSEETENPEELYTPLTCELCSETFTIPADWVKHVQTHTDMMPAKRQKRGRPSNEDDDSNFPPLQCDMCQEFFATPAKWVQHIQSAHTEQEMQEVNKASRNGSAGPLEASSGRQRQRSASGHHHGLRPTSQQKICDRCDKKFPSHASMLIHKRTHTGERPYMCDYCCKGFNVKSNLLRHLRTLHGKCVNPTEVESSREGDESDT